MRTHLITQWAAVKTDLTVIMEAPHMYAHPEVPTNRRNAAWYGTSLISTSKPLTTRDESAETSNGSDVVKRDNNAAK